MKKLILIAMLMGTSFSGVASQDKMGASSSSFRSDAFSYVCEICAYVACPGCLRSTSDLTAILHVPVTGFLRQD